MRRASFAKSPIFLYLPGPVQIRLVKPNFVVGAQINELESFYMREATNIKGTFLRSTLRGVSGDPGTRGPFYLPVGKHS